MAVAFAKRLNSIDDLTFIDGEKISDECFPLLGVNGDPPSFVPFLKWIPLVSKSNTYLTYIIQRSCDYLNRVFQFALFNKRNSFSDLNGMTGDLPPTTFAWCLAILTHHLDVQEKIRQEVVQYLRQHDDQFPRINDIHLFPYTQSVLKECLRYQYNNNFNVPRKLHQNVTVNGIVISKGTMIAIPSFSMHINEHVYQNANTFDPE
ncbi:unnamed protein product [Cunninghamella echinulata]